jgi:predicted TIM-barrel fold metal-dependent hydrolase
MPWSSSILRKSESIMNSMLFDTDQHITEPRDVWTDRMSAEKWGDLVPHVKVNEAPAESPYRRSGEYSEEWWYIGDMPVAPLGGSVMFVGPDGRPERRENSFGGFDQVHPSAYDAKARLEVMDQSGVAAAVFYPNLGFVGTNIYRAVGDSSVDFQLDALRAYNDFIWEWCSADPTRLTPVAGIPFWNVDGAVVEINRCAELGFKALVTTGKPHLHGQPFLMDPHWDRMWSAAEDCGMSVAFHAAGGDPRSDREMLNRVALAGFETALAHGTSCMFFETGLTAVDLLLSAVLPRFPRLKFMLAEAGIGWVPMALEAADYHFKKYRIDRAHPAYGRELPSAYFRSQVYVSCWFEELTDFHVDRIGADKIVFETDYPHPTCLCGDEVDEAIRANLAGVSDEVRERVLWKNAAELYGRTSLSSS